MTASVIAYLVVGLAAASFIALGVGFTALSRRPGKPTRRRKSQ